MEKLKGYFAEQEYTIKESDKKFKIQACCPTNEDEVLMNVKVEKADENVMCVRFEKVHGGKMNYLNIFKEVKDYLIEAEMIINP